MAKSKTLLAPPRPRVRKSNENTWQVSYRGHTGTITRHGSTHWTAGFFKPGASVGLASPRFWEDGDAFNWLMRKIGESADVSEAYAAGDAFLAKGGEAKLKALHPQAWAAWERFTLALRHEDSRADAVIGLANLRKMAAKKRQPKAVEHLKQSGDRFSVYSATVHPGLCVTVHGRSYFIGDDAEYDSYNLNYIGTIVGIGKKTVTFKVRNETRKRRLSVDEFAWRNRKSVAEKAAHNAEERMYI